MSPLNRIKPLEESIIMTMYDSSDISGYPSIDKPWLKYYSKEAINNELTERSIYEYMYENNKDYPRDIALNYFGKKISYGELFANIDRTAAAFQAIGVKEGEIVTVALPSIPETLYVVYALNKIGAVANMIHLLAGKNEIIDYLNEVESKVAVIFDKTMEILGDDIAKTSVNRAIVLTAGASLPFWMRQLHMLINRFPVLSGVYEKWEDFINNGRDTGLKPFKKDCHTLAIISHTGGTTGEPKGVMCSDYNINALIYQSICCFKHNERGHRALVVLPPFINYSLVQSMLEMIYLGYIVVLLPKYEPGKIWTYLKKYRPNVVLSIPPYWEYLISTKRKDVDLSCFEQVYYGGEAMSKEKEQSIDLILKECGSKTELLKGLGSTELTAVASQTYPWCNDIGSVGLPLVKMNCKVIDSDSYEEMPYGKDGEICFSGPTLMLGYYNNTLATDDVIKYHKDGERWFHTGDIGHINENGVIFVSGRIKRMVATKGLDGQPTKFFPDRIEKVISSNSIVEICCVIGVPDEKRINYPKAFVVLKQGEATTDSTRQSIIETCKSALPEYMIPDEIEFCPDLPRTSRGKVDYRALEESQNAVRIKKTN